jgi:predicted TIM-barrel fold metal-dependent hydrolase
MKVTRSRVEPRSIRLQRAPDEADVSTLPVVDCHHHLWNLDANRYPWLSEFDAKPIYGDYSAIRRNYLLDDFRRDAATLKLTKSVHVEAGHDPADPVRETRWLQSLADRPDSAGFPHGIVAYADFHAPDVEALLAGHAESPNVRGIRQVLNPRKNPWLPIPDDPLANPQWRKRIGLLRKFNCSFDLQVYCQQMELAASLAAENPDTLFILNHAGMPARRDAEGLAGWKRGIRLMAQRENMVVKLSGFGMVDPQWTVESIRPFVLEIIDVFGTERSMFASNFPVDRIMSDYRRLWRAYFEITQDFSLHERTVLFSANAIRFYRL